MFMVPTMLVMTTLLAPNTVDILVILHGGIKSVGNVNLTNRFDSVSMLTQTRDTKCHWRVDHTRSVLIVSNHVTNNIVDILATPTILLAQNTVGVLYSICCQ